MSEAPKPPAPDVNPFATPKVTYAGNAEVGAVPLQSYALVRTGLQLIYYSIAAMFLMAIMIVIGVSVGGAAISSGTSAGPGVLFIVMGLGALGIFGAFLAMLVGFCLALAAPNPNEKPLASISVVCFVLSIGVAIGSGVLEGMGSGLLLSGSLDVLGNILQCASTIAFCLFLKRVGENILSDSLQRAAKSALIWMGLTYIVMLVGGIALAVLGGTAGSFGASPGDFFALALIPFILAIIVLGLGALFTYLAMLRSGINELKPKFHG